MISEYIPFFHALLVILGAFVLILLELYHEQFTAFIGKRKMKLRDKLHYSMMQNRGAA